MRQKNVVRAVASAVVNVISNLSSKNFRDSYMNAMASEASAPPSTIKNESLIGVPIGPPICPPSNFFSVLTRLPTWGAKIVGINKSGEMSASAPPYTIPNQSQMGVPIGPPIGGPTDEMPKQQPPPYQMQPPQPSYSMQPPQQYSYPVPPQQPYPYPMPPPAPVNNSTVNVHQVAAASASASATPGQTVYVIKKKTGGCCFFVLLVIVAIIVGTVYGVRASRYSRY